MGRYSSLTTLRLSSAIPWWNSTSKSTSSVCPEFCEESTDHTISEHTSIPRSVTYWTFCANSAQTESQLRSTLKRLATRQRASDLLPAHMRVCALTLELLTAPVALTHTTKQLFDWRWRRCSPILACSLWRRTATLTLI